MRQRLSSITTRIKTLSRIPCRCQNLPVRDHLPLKQGLMPIVDRSTRKDGGSRLFLFQLISVYGDWGASLDRAICFLCWLCNRCCYTGHHALDGGFSRQDLEHCYRLFVVGIVRFFSFLFLFFCIFREIVSFITKLN